MKTKDENIKQSYKTIILDTKEMSVTKEKPIEFTDYENVIIPSRITSTPLKINKNSTSQYMLEILQQVADITNDIKDVYGFHGFANDITLKQVLDCIEKSTIVEIISDMESENNTDDEEILS